MKNLLIVAFLAMFTTVSAQEPSPLTPKNFDPAVDMERVSDEINAATPYEVTTVKIAIMKDQESFEAAYNFVGVNSTNGFETFADSPNYISDQETIYEMAKTLQPTFFTDNNGVEHLVEPMMTPQTMDTENITLPAIEATQGMDSYFQTLASYSSETGYYFIAWFMGGSESGMSFGLIEPETATSIDSSTELNLTVFPNPATNNVTITGLPGIGRQIVTVYDMKGNVVHKFRSVQNQEVLDLSNLATGSYVLEVLNLNKKKRTTKQFVIQR